MIHMRDYHEVRFMLSDYKMFPEFRDKKLAVVGSRMLDDSDYMDFVLRAFRPKRIITGGAKGADKLAEEWARDNSIPCDVYYPDLIRWPYHRFKGKAYLERNISIATACDALIAFLPMYEESRGTLHTISQAKKLRKPIMGFYF